MKRIATLFTAVTMSILLLFGCSKSNTITTETDNNTTTEAENNTELSEKPKITVMTSFYPMYDFALNIGRDKVKVVNMVPSGIEPHDWEPAASDIVGLEEANVFIHNGVGMEHWVETVLETLGNKNLIVVEAAEGVSLIEGHDHEDEDDHEDEEENLDPHVWLSPLNVKVQVKNIRDAFVVADPENADYYNENYEVYIGKLDALDQKFKDSLSNVANKDIIVAHEAYGYLCEAYGLNQIGIEGLSPTSDPNPARMEEIIELAKEKQIKIIFFEELVSPKVAQTIADEIGVVTEVLNPIEGLTEEQLEAGEDYISIMEDNLSNLLKALQ